MDLSGLLNLEPDDLAKMSLSRLNRRIRRLMTEANNRLDILEATDLRGIAPATRTDYLQSHNRFVMPDNPTKTNSRFLYKQLTNFLNAKTSNYGEAQEYWDNMTEKTNIYDRDIMRDFWLAYNMVKEDPNFAVLWANIDSNNIRDKAVTAFYPGKSILENVELMKEKLNVTDFSQDVQPEGYIPSYDDMANFFKENSW